VGFVSLKDKQMNEKKYRCWKTHGSVDFWRAVSESCDSYFYLLGAQVGPQRIAEMATLFGGGQAVQDVLPGESIGHIPDSSWKRRKRLGGWSTGDTYNMSIGQGFVTSTPLQMAMMMAGVATRGRFPSPAVVQSVENTREETAYAPLPRSPRVVSFKESSWEILQKALRLVITQGTGGACNIPTIEVHGKTGTAQNPHGHDHAWFAAYAGVPGEAPSVAVCVFVENGGNGGTVAAPIARKILEILLPPKTGGAVS
jgi:penicillin-binding protein 2